MISKAFTTVCLLQLRAICHVYTSKGSYRSLKKIVIFIEDEKKKFNGVKNAAQMLKSVGFAECEVCSVWGLQSVGGKKFLIQKQLDLFPKFDSRVCMQFDCTNWYRNILSFWNFGQLGSFASVTQPDNIHLEKMPRLLQIAAAVFCSCIFLFPY